MLLESVQHFIQVRILMKHVEIENSDQYNWYPPLTLTFRELSIALFKSLDLAS